MRTVFFTIFLVTFFGFFSSCSKKQISFNDPGEIKWKSNSPQIVKSENTKERSSSQLEISASNSTEPLILNSKTSNSKPSKKSNLLDKYQKEVKQKLNTSNATEAAIKNNPLREGEQSKVTRKERREFKRVVKKAAKSQDIETNTLLLVIIAILLPPVAVGLLKGWGSGAFWLNLALTLLAFWVGGIIHALYILFSGE